MTPEEHVIELRARLDDLEKRVGEKPKYKPGDRVVLFRRLGEGYRLLQRDLARDFTIVLDKKTDQDFFSWHCDDSNITHTIDESMIKCLAPEPEPKAEVDWSKVPKGTMVEVRNNEKLGWMLGYFRSYHASEIDPFSTQDSFGDIIGDYEQCRLYEGPGAMVWHDWKGGKECPVPEDKIALCVFRNNDIVALYRFGKKFWRHEGDGGDIIKYAIIDPPPSYGGGE